MPRKAQLTKAELEAHIAELEEQHKKNVEVKQHDPWTLLSREFDPKIIRKNPKGFHYVSIDAVYNRLDEVLGPNWQLSVQGVACAPVDPSWKQYGSRTPKTGFLATCTVRITALIDGSHNPPIHTVRDGVGADFADDPDKAIKTALANAVKKAANGFGVGRYLWNEEERAAIDEANEARNDTKALKRRVISLYAQQAGAEKHQQFELLAPSDKLKTLSAHFDVPVEDLASADTLNKILEG